MQANEQDNRVKVAVFGHGHLGKWHAEKVDLVEGGKLVAIIEPHAETREIIRKKYPGVETVADQNELTVCFDAAIIVTPTSGHYPLINSLVKSQKHIFCEKPMCETTSEGEVLKKQMLDKLVFQVGHSERYHKIWETIFSRNELQYFMQDWKFVRFDRFAPFKGRATDVDVVRDLMIHDIDLLLYLFKEVPTFVEATGVIQKTGKWDFVHADFSFASGKKATICAHRNYFEEKRVLEVFSEKGFLKVDMLKNQLSFSHCDYYEGVLKSEKYEKRDHLYLQQVDFINAIKGSLRPLVSFKEGFEAVNIIDKVIASAVSKKRMEI